MTNPVSCDTKKQKIECVFKELNEFLVNVEYGDITIKKQNHEVVLIEKRETKKL